MRSLAEAPADEEVALLADIDIAHLQDLLQLFPFFGTRRPDTYAALTNPRINTRKEGGEGEMGPIPGLAWR